VRGGTVMLHYLLNRRGGLRLGAECRVREKQPGCTAKPCIRTVKPTILTAGQTLNSVPPDTFMV